MTRELIQVSKYEAKLRLFGLWALIYSGNSAQCRRLEISLCEI